MQRPLRNAAACLTTAALLMIIGCGKPDASGARHASFSTPEEAASALVAAVGDHDVDKMRALFGPGVEGLLSSGDEAVDRAARESFLRKYGVRHQFSAGGPDNLVLHVGDEDWPLPIPLVRRESGWRFDGAAGADELILRRIGRNELRTIDVMRGFVAAQKDYAATSHDGVAAGAYAQRLKSLPGRQDGLYWDVAAGGPLSPAGPLLADAATEGYTSAEGTRTPYHGYRYRTLFAQGPAASGGAREYVVDGMFTDGFALIASPDAYGVSGVMTFMVNQDGVVWQRDLGQATAKVAAAIHQFDPDETWTPIAPEG